MLLRTLLHIGVQGRRDGGQVALVGLMGVWRGRGVQVWQAPEKP